MAPEPRTGERPVAHDASGGAALAHRSAGRPPTTFPAEAVVALLSRLVAAPSVNPFGDELDASPDYGEVRVAELVAAVGREIGLDVSEQPVLPGRANVLLTLPGRDPNRRLLLETHMDTVKTGRMASPFEPRLEGGRLYGRGSCDAKGCLAAMLLALQHAAAQDEPPPATVTLAAVVDEEYAYRGVSALLGAGLQADAAVVGEPTELAVVLAHKGCVRWRIEVEGRSAHSSRPEEGVNAIMQMRRVLNLIAEEIEPELARRAHPWVGPPTLSVGVIQGGVQSNMVPDRCVIDIDRRLTPGERAEEALAEFAAHLDRLRRRHPDLQVTSHPPYVLDIPMEVPQEAPIVQTALAACRSVLSEVWPASGAGPVGVPFGTDASKLVAAGIPSIVFGPGSIRDAHTDTESVAIAEVQQAAAVLAELIRRF